MYVMSESDRAHYKVPADARNARLLSHERVIQMDLDSTNQIWCPWQQKAYQSFADYLDSNRPRLISTLDRKSGVWCPWQQKFYDSFVDYYQDLDKLRKS